MLNIHLLAMYYFGYKIEEILFFLFEDITSIQYFISTLLYRVLTEYKVFSIHPDPIRVHE